MVWLTFAPVTTVAADKYGVSEAAIGWLANVFVLGFVLLAIPAGFLIDRNLRGRLAARCRDHRVAPAYDSVATRSTGC